MVGTYSSRRSGARRKPAAAIDHGIGEIGRDDLPPEAMGFHRIGKLLANLGAREVLGQFAGEQGSSGTAVTSRSS